MKKTILFILIIGLNTMLHAQEINRDSLKKALAKATDDYTRFRLADQLVRTYVSRYPDSAVTYAQQNMVLGTRLKSDSLLFVAPSGNTG